MVTCSQDRVNRTHKTSAPALTWCPTQTIPVLLQAGFQKSRAFRRALMQLISRFVFGWSHRVIGRSDIHLSPIITAPMQTTHETCSKAIFRRKAILTFWTDWIFPVEFAGILRRMMQGRVANRKMKTKNVCDVVITISSNC